jgi:ectoine hydroxylase-related dioxygenase (phytanoyl-CoA dioxygenase family)
MLNASQRQQLAEQGWLLFQAHLPSRNIPPLLARLEELWAVEGNQAGAENYIEPGVRRLANLADKGDLFRRIYADPLVLAAVEAVMGPDMRASMVNARDVPPHTGARLPFHMDSDGGRHRDEKGYNAATAIWMLDAFTIENGATAFIPGSHLLGKSPRQALADPFADHPDEIILTGAPGDVLVFNGHCWHAGRPNQTSQPRRALLVHYLRADIPRPPNRRQHLQPAHAAALTPRERKLLGLDDPA